ncbi:hypothetical protein VPH35_136464 [Triticum aestivum]
MPSRCALLAWCMFVMSVRGRLSGRCCAIVRIGAGGHGHGGIQVCLSVVTGLYPPPGPPGPAGDKGVGTSYSGGADSDPVADAGLGVKGGPFPSYYFGWVVVMWMVGCA